MNVEPVLEKKKNSKDLPSFQKTAGIERTRRAHPAVLTPPLAVVFKQPVL